MLYKSRTKVEQEDRLTDSQTDKDIHNIDICIIFRLLIADIFLYMVKKGIRKSESVLFGQPTSIYIIC